MCAYYASTVLFQPGWLPRTDAATVANNGCRYCCCCWLCYCRNLYTVLKPRWPLDLIDRGDPTQTSGWYDVQCQGGTNDYCRWVGNTSSGTIGGASGAGYWSCAMAGLELPETPPGRILEDYIISTVCQETGYKAQPQRDLTCGDLSLPRENNCQTRQCCKTKCDSNRLCTGFVFGNSAGNNCRSNGDGQNCCWLKGGTCTSAFNPLTAAYQKTEDSGGSTTCSSVLVPVLLAGHATTCLLLLFDVNRLSGLHGSGYAHGVDGGSNQQLQPQRCCTCSAVRGITPP
jgi:hypothetical protein